MRRLQKRELVFLAVGALFLATMGVAWAVEGLVLEPMAKLERQIAARERDKALLVELVGRYRELAAKHRAFQLRLGREGGEPFLALLDRIIAQSQMQGQLDTLRPQGTTDLGGILETSVEVKFSRVALHQALELLRRFSIGDVVVSIKRLSLERRYEDRQLLDLSLVLASYRAAEAR